MQDRIAELEARLASVEKRLRALEGEAELTPTYDDADSEPTLDDGLVANVSTHIGRVLLIFGGAYLLRAMTDFEFVPTAMGIAMGAAYAVFWLIMAFRKGAHEGSRTAAALYAGTSVFLALPLFVEAVTKFELLNGAQGLAAVSGYFLVALFVALRRDLRSLAWLAAGGSIVSAAGILIATHVAISAVAVLIGIGLASLWATYRSDWLGLQWLGALGASAGILVLLVFSQSDQWSLEPVAAARMAAVLFSLYFASFILQTHIRRRSIGLFEVFHAAMAGGITLWAVNAAVAAGQLDTVVVGVQITLLGALAYGLGLTPGARTERKHNFFYYTTLGLALILVGTSMSLPSLWAATVWCLMAVVAAILSGRMGWVTLSLQCTFLLVAAGIGSGLLDTGLHALAGGGENSWALVTPAHVGVALMTVVCLFIPVTQSSEKWGAMAGLPQLIVLVLSVWEVGGVFVGYTAPLIAGSGGAEANAAVLAALRTAVLSVSSVVLAVSSRFKRWPEARWLVYPVIVLVAVKLFVEDFPNGEPASLFVALFFVGGALLAAARLLKQRSAQPQGA
jgi:hypothetical protein